MKKLVYLILALSCVPCLAKDARVNVRVTGSTDSTVYLYRPVENFPLGRTDTVYVRKGADITISLPVTELSTMAMINGGHYTTLIVEPGKEYSLTFDHTKKPIVEVNDSAQMILNRVFEGKNFYKYEFVKNYNVAPLDTVATKMLANFEELIARDKAQFSGIKMSPQKRAFIDHHIEMFWIGSMSKAIRNGYFDMIRNNIPMYPGYVEMWQQLYRKYPLDASMTPSYLLRDYVDMMILMQKAIAKDYNMPKSLDQAMEQTYDMTCKVVSDPKMCRAVLASSLYFEGMNNKAYDTAIIKHIDTFNLKYPNNQYARRLEPFVKEVAKFNEVIKNGFSSGVKFVPNGDSISTFAEVLAQFKGKPIFVDFWFASCSPCCEEFAYGAPLKEFLKENGIEMLYISVDRKQDQWHNAIKFYNLEGNHVRTRQKLHEDIYNNYGVGSFPRFMIIDADGRILVDKARRPSQGQALYDQIKTALKLQ